MATSCALYPCTCCCQGTMGQSTFIQNVDYGDCLTFNCCYNVVCNTPTLAMMDQNVCMSRGSTTLLKNDGISKKFDGKNALVNQVFVKQNAYPINNSCCKCLRCPCMCCGAVDECFESRHTYSFFCNADSLEEAQEIVSVKSKEIPAVENITNGCVLCYIPKCCGIYSCCGICPGASYCAFNLTKCLSVCPTLLCCNWSSLPRYLQRVEGNYLCCKYQGGTETEYKNCRCAFGKEGDCITMKNEDGLKAYDAWSYKSNAYCCHSTNIGSSQFEFSIYCDSESFTENCCFFSCGDSANLPTGCAMCFFCCGKDSVEDFFTNKQKPLAIDISGKTQEETELGKSWFKVNN